MCISPDSVRPCRLFGSQPPATNAGVWMPPSKSVVLPPRSGALLPAASGPWTGEPLSLAHTRSVACHMPTRRRAAVTSMARVAVHAHVLSTQSWLADACPLSLSSSPAPTKTRQIRWSGGGVDVRGGREGKRGGEGREERHKGAATLFSSMYCMLINCLGGRATPQGSGGVGCPRPAPIAG